VVLRTARWKLSTRGIIRHETVRDSADVGSCRSSDRVGSAAIMVNNPQANGKRAAADALNPNAQTRSKGVSSTPRPSSRPRGENLCRGCGKSVNAGREHCANCAVSPATERLVSAARLGRAAARTPEALAKQSDSQSRHSAARSSWDKSSQPSWLTAELFTQKIQPLLSKTATSVIRTRIGVSRWYASRIRQGHRPHPRHWVTTSNRFLRDHATKSLVNVIGNKSDVLPALLGRFRTVNDPYVLERICAVAYGCAMRTDNVAALKALATAVYNWFFATGKPYTHILFRDCARGGIEVAVSAGAQLEFDVSKVRSPYKSTWPKTIPLASELEAKYGWRKDKMPDTEWARLSIYSSVMGSRDFARYVIGTNSGSFEWTKTRLGKRPAMTAKDKYERFLGRLKKKQRNAWQRFQELRWQSVIEGLRRGLPDQPKANTLTKDSSKSGLRASEGAFEATLSPSELKTYRKDVLGVSRQTSRRRRSIRPLDCAAMDCSARV